MSTPSLCQKYKLGKSTVLDILASQNVPMRGRGLTAAQVQEVAGQCAAGDSLATIAI